MMKRHQEQRKAIVVSTPKKQPLASGSTDSKTDSGSADSEQRSHKTDHSEGAELWAPPLSEHASSIAVGAEDIEPCGPPDFFSSAQAVEAPASVPLASASLVGAGSPRPGMRCPVMTYNLETCTGHGLPPLAASAGHTPQRQSATAASVSPKIQPDGACHGLTSIGHQAQGASSPSERGRQLANLDIPVPQKAQGMK